MDDYGAIPDLRPAVSIPSRSTTIPPDLDEAQQATTTRHQTTDTRSHHLLHRDNLILTPCPQRVDNMRHQISRHVETDRLSPEDDGQVQHPERKTRRCNILSGRLVGKVGRAPRKALYARANSSTHQLEEPTRALRGIIRHCRPLTIPRTDAYFELGRRIYRPGDDDLPSWNSDDTVDIENGWAAVCFHQSDAQRGTYFQDRAGPTIFLRPNLDLSPRSLGRDVGTNLSSNLGSITSTSSVAKTKPPDTV